MHSRSWNRCLAQDPGTGEWCGRPPTDGVFCSPHTWGFRCDEAAKAATRLARATLTTQTESATRWQRWWAERQARRARSLRRSLLTKVDGVGNGGAEIGSTPKGQGADARHQSLSAKRA